MASIKLTGDTSGEITISAPAVAGTNTLTLPATTGSLMTSTFTGDINFDSDTLVVDSTNNRVGIGTSSPNAKLHISGNSNNSATLSDTVTDYALKFDSATTTNYFSNAICFAEGTNVNSSIAGFDGGSGGNHGLVFGTGASNTERMRINSDGKIGIAVSGIGFVQMGMRINGQSWFAVWEDDAGNDKFRVASSGNVQNSNNSYGGISDSKLKENVVDASDKLEDLKRVQIKNFNFIGDSQKQIGVIAQELETVFPGMVENHPDLDEDGNDLGTVTKSVKYSVFVPILIKSLQEQQTIIEDLQTRITALENN